MRDPEKKKSSSWIPLLVFLLFLNPVLIVPVALFGCGFLLVRQTMKKQSTVSRPKARKESFDECHQPIFCFHKDKAEHHVKRGKEMDPWDRPDIDISKYQRNR